MLSAVLAHFTVPLPIAHCLLPHLLPTPQTLASTSTGTLIAVAGVIGLVAGIVGGLAGIGGSIVMLPGLALLLGYQDETRSEQHTYQAAAMMVNVLVAIPAALRHRRESALRLDIVKPLLPAMAVAVVIGVLLSNRLEGRALSHILAVFVAAYCVIEIVKVIRRHPDQPAPDEPTSIKRQQMFVIGALAGLAGGLLGVGGGVVMVPLLQVVARVPLRAAIAASATVMCFTAVIASSSKVASLPSLGLPIADALILMAAMGPPAAGGAWFGAKLTHTMPVSAVRLVVSIILLGGAARLGGLL